MAFDLATACLQCLGTGNIGPYTCPHCLGTGQEVAHAGGTDTDQGAEAQGRENRGGQVQVGDVAQRVQERPEGDGPEAGYRDRTERKWAEQTPLTAGEVEEKLIGIEKAAAQERKVLNAKTVRVFLRDGTYVDVHFTISWSDWMLQVLNWRGIMFEPAGWIPIDLIRLIAPPTAQGDAQLGENVVPFKKPL
jgi:hypothetical protein